MKVSFKKYIMEFSSKKIKIFFLLFRHPKNKIFLIVLILIIFSISNFLIYSPSLCNSSNYSYAYADNFYDSIRQKGILQKKDFIATNKTIVSVKKSEEDLQILPNWDWQKNFESRVKLLKLNSKHKMKKFLTIGISSVFRENKTYLIQTLHAFLNESIKEERENCTILIFLADVRTDFRERNLEQLKINFQNELNSGFFQVIETNEDIYPSFNFIFNKRTFDDSVERVVWRAKQTLDFSFLFSYAKDLSEYYLVMEDDIIPSFYYITAIRDFINSRKSNHWTFLDFGNFMQIGCLFHSRELDKIVKFLHLFYEKMPVDMLIRQFISIQTGDIYDDTIKRIPGLFQHIGLYSSLPNKIQKEIDFSFEFTRNKFRNINPPAKLKYSMEFVEEFSPEYAYKPYMGYFWGITENNRSYSPEKFEIFFSIPQNISRIFITSGLKGEDEKTHQIVIKDLIQDGQLEIGEVRMEGNEFYCDQKSTTIGTFKNGLFDMRILLRRNIQCLRILIGQLQNTWIIIREIAIFTKN